MVATFHLYCLGHRVKYGNPEVRNNTLEFLPTTQPCYSIEFIESFLFWVILITYNIGIYICIYIYKVSYIHSFLLSSTVMFFSALHAKHFEIRKNILLNWRVDCFIARSIKRCDIGFNWIALSLFSEIFDVFPSLQLKSWDLKVFNNYLDSFEFCTSFSSK